MRCDVLLFAELAEAVGRRRMTLDLPDGATVAEALSALSKDHEAIAAQRERLAVALEETYCDPQTVIADGQTLALIPPVSGG